MSGPSGVWWAIGGTVFAVGATVAGGIMLLAKTISIKDTFSGISVVGGNSIDGFATDPPHLPLVHPADDEYDSEKLSVKSNITGDGVLTVTARLKGAVATAHATAWKKNQAVAANWISYRLFLELQARIPTEAVNMRENNKTLNDLQRLVGEVVA